MKQIIISAIALILLNIQFVLCRKCAYFPSYPDLSKISYKNCNYGDSCYEGYTADGSSVCENYGTMWWLLFIVIAAVIFLVIAIVLICCLVRKGKQLRKEEAAALLSNPTSSNYNPYSVQKPFEISERDKDSDLTAPNYISLFERQQSMIQKDDGGINVALPATHLVDQNTFDTNATALDIIPSGPIKPRRLTPIQTTSE